MDTGSYEALELENQSLNNQLKFAYEKRNAFFQHLANLYYFEYKRKYESFFWSMFFIFIVFFVILISFFLKYVDQKSLYFYFLFSFFYALYLYKQCLFYAILLKSFQYHLFDFGKKLVVDKSGLERFIKVTNNDDDRIEIYFNPNKIGSLSSFVNS